MSPTILRFSTAFGLSPRMRFDLTINQFTRELAIGNELVVYDADTWRPYCHVQDFAHLIQLVIEAPNDKVAFEIFNAGADENNATKKMVVDCILEKNLPGKVQYKAHGNDPRNYIVDFEKVKTVLGFQPRKTIDDGISELLDSINNHVFDNVDLNKNFHGNYEINYQVPE
jgi:nucleoside-diphosphate-sugar epimerase